MSLCVCVCVCMYMCRYVIHTFFLTKYKSAMLTTAKARSRIKLPTFSTIMLPLSSSGGPINRDKEQFQKTAIKKHLLIS